MSERSLRGKVAVAGVGETTYWRHGKAPHSEFKLALMAKDVGIAAALARDLGVDTPYLRETLKLWRAAQRELPARADHTEIYRYLERLTSPSPAARARRSNFRRKRRRAR